MPRLDDAATKYVSDIARDLCRRVGIDPDGYGGRYMVSMFLDGYEQALKDMNP